MRSWRSVILASVAVVGAVIVLLWFHAIFVDKCIGYAESGQQSCHPENLLNIFFSETLAVVTHAEFYTAVATICIAVFTFFLKGSTDNLKTSTEAIAAAQSNETRILQRAYLSVVPKGIRPFNSGDGRFSCDVSFVNAGKLPAREVRWAIDRAFSSEPAKRNFELPEASFTGSNVIAPSAFMTKGGTGIDADSYNAGVMRPGDSWLYVWGEVRYYDGFGMPRFTKFCHRYNCAGVRKESGTIGAGISAEAARQHVHGNDAD